MLFSNLNLLCLICSISCFVTLGVPGINVSGAGPGMNMSETSLKDGAPSAAIYESDVFNPAPLQSRASLSAEEILARVEVAKLGEASSGGAIDIKDVINAGELTDEKRKEIAKALVEKHMIESVDLENQLRENEINEINFILQDMDVKKKQAILEIQQELKVNGKKVVLNNQCFALNFRISKENLGIVLQ